MIELRQVDDGLELQEGVTVFRLLLEPIHVDQLTYVLTVAALSICARAPESDGRTRAIEILEGDDNQARLRVASAVITARLRR